MRDIRGITLIALIITIIVLLILAGITIVQLTGSGLFGKAETANQKTRYATAKETINLKLMEIQLDCTQKNEEYDIIKIAEGMEEAKDITIEKYYNKKEASIKEDITKNITNLEGIVVSVDKYSEYKFLIGEECKIKGVLEGDITNTTNKEDFIDAMEFEKNKFNETNDLKSNTEISFEPKKYTNKDNIDLTVKIKNNKGIKYIECQNIDTKYQGNGQSEIEINYTVARNGTYEFKVIDNEENEEIKSIVVNLFDRVEPKNFTPIKVKVKSTSVILKGNAEDGDETEDSLKSGIEKYEYYINGAKAGESEVEEFEITNLTSNTSYNIYLVAYDKAGNLKQSETINVTTISGKYATLTASGIIDAEEELASDALTKEAFDGDMNTYIPGGNVKSLYINIDESLWNKKLTFYFQAGPYHLIRLYNNTNNQIFYQDSRANKHEVTILPNTARLVVYFNEGGALYEVEFAK